MKKTLMIVLGAWSIWALLVDNYALATTQSVSFKLSVTIPAMAGVNTPLQESQAQLSDLTLKDNPNNDTIVEETIRDHQRVELKTVVVK